MSDFSTYTTIPTYDKLVMGIQRYINRFDQPTLETIPFFINAAEKTILRALRMPSMEKMVKFTLNGQSEPAKHRFITIPLDYLEMKFVWTDNGTLERVTFDHLLEMDEFDKQPCWAINANRMYIYGVDGDEDIYMTYYADIEELSEGSQNNVLLDLVPDAFLYLAVAEGFMFLMEEEKSNFWASKGVQRLQEVQAQVESAEFSGAPLSIRMV